MTGTKRGQLLMMAKAPEPGRVKTRLAAAIGDQQAAALASAFLKDAWASLAPLPDLEPILVLSGPACSLPPLRPEPRIWPQGEGDLGARLERAFRRSLETARFAIAVGTDSPGLPPERIHQAAEALASGEHEAVLGPTADGGYYLIGLVRCPEGLFAGLPWSSEQTRGRTLERLRQRSMPACELDDWFDVDEPEDLEHLRDRLEAGLRFAQWTARALDADALLQRREAG